MSWRNFGNAISGTTRPELGNISSRSVHANSPVQPPQRSLGFVLGDESRFLVSTLDRHRRPDDLHALKRLRSSALASLFVRPFPASICFTAVRTSRSSSISSTMPHTPQHPAPPPPS